MKNHMRVLSMAFGHRTVKEFARDCGINPQLIYKFIRNNEVPEKYRKQIADASEGKIKPYWFSPVYEDEP
jgi:hypothetical protein